MAKEPKLVKQQDLPADIPSGGAKIDRTKPVNTGTPQVSQSGQSSSYSSDASEKERKS